MSETNGKTVLEHLLDNNKKMILASRYQNTIYYYNKGRGHFAFQVFYSLMQVQILILSFLSPLIKRTIVSGRKMINIKCK